MLLVPYFPCRDNFILRLRIELLSFHKSVRRKGDICVSGALENRQKSLSIPIFFDMLK